MEEGYVLVIITAGNCGHCKNLKKVWADIKPKIISATGVQIVEVELSSMNSPIDTSKFPSDLKRYKMWYPMAILFSLSEWRDAMSNTQSTIKLNGKVVGGKFSSEGVLIMDKSKTFSPADSDRLIDWIKETIDSGVGAPSISRSESAITTISTMGNNNNVAVIPLVANPSRGAPYIPQTSSNTNYVGTQKMNVCGMRITKRE